MANLLTATTCQIRLDHPQDRNFQQSGSFEGLAVHKSSTWVRQISLRKRCGLRLIFTLEASPSCQALTTSARLSGQERHEIGRETTLGLGHEGGQEITLGFLDRLLLAWRILFPGQKTSSRSLSSNALVAKERLRMILISDRCSVNELAKKKIVDNIVGALADFVVIESEEKIKLNVSVDPDLGAVYAVTVPVRRVKPEYQSHSKELQDAELQETTEDKSEEAFQSATLSQADTHPAH